MKYGKFGFEIALSRTNYQMQKMMVIWRLQAYGKEHIKRKYGVSVSCGLFKVRTYLDFCMHNRNLLWLENNDKRLYYLRSLAKVDKQSPYYLHHDLMERRPTPKSSVGFRRCHTRKKFKHSINPFFLCSIITACQLGSCIFCSSKKFNFEKKVY